MQDSMFIGLDVHKATISVAVAQGERGGQARHRGTISHRPDHVRKLVEKLGAGGSRLHFCYEAGPCGYGLHRQLFELGHDCIVVAPSLIPGEGGRPCEDGPPRCDDAGEAAPRGRVDGGVGCRASRT